MEAQDSGGVPEFIAARQMPRRVFEQLPEAEHDTALAYLGWVEEGIDYVFIAERKEGGFVRVSGGSVWDAIAAPCEVREMMFESEVGEPERVKAEVRLFRERLPRISLK